MTHNKKKWYAVLGMVFFWIFPFGQCQKEIFRCCALKASKVHLRLGPDMDQDIVWIYLLKSKYWPVRILQSKNHWYEIQDQDGYRGWVNGAMLSFRTFAAVSQDKSCLYRYPGKSPIAFMDKGVVLAVLKEKDNFSYVRVSQNGLCGWIARKHLWPESSELPLKKIKKT